MGLDPPEVVIFVQSRVPQTAELALVFGMITPLGWLERVPTYKEQIEQLRERDLGTFGFLGYPGPHDGRHRALPRALRPRRQGPGEPPRDLPRDRPALQRLLRRRLPGAEGALHGDAEGSGPRRPEDVQELRQHARALGLGRGRREEGHGDGHGPGPRAPLGPRRPGRLQPVSVPRPLLAARRAEGRRRGVPRGDARLRGLQEAPHPQHERGAGADPPEARGDRREEGLREGRPRGRERERAEAIATDTMENVSDAMGLL